MVPDNIRISQNQSNQESKIRISDEVVAAIASVAAVSYTHLDVYKRQRYGRKLWGRRKSFRSL